MTSRVDHIARRFAVVRKRPLENGKSPAERSFPSLETSAELSSHESRDPSTEGFGLLGALGLRQDADDGLGSRRPDEHPPAVPQLGVDPLHLGLDRRSQAPLGDGNILARLREAWHDGRHFAERPAVESTAEEQRGDEPVAGDVTVEPDQMSGLLAAEDPALAAECFEDIAVADVRRPNANPAT